MAGSSLLDVMGKTIFEVGGMPISGWICLGAFVVVFALLCMWLSNGESGPSCSARHILVKTKEEAEALVQRCTNGEDFATLAKECSTCPSGKSGGSLGNFSPGQMVPAFDKVCFDAGTKLGEVLGPIKTQFGYHLIIVDKREGKLPKSCNARHILVKTKEEANAALQRVNEGEEFQKVAADLSTCPSGKRGGSLGSFGPGQMVPAFDKVCFDPATKLGETVGPIQTQFGYHLIVVESRSGVDKPEDEKTK